MIQYKSKGRKFQLKVWGNTLKLLPKSKVKTYKTKFQLKVEISIGIKPINR